MFIGSGFLPLGHSGSPEISWALSWIWAPCSWPVEASVRLEHKTLNLDDRFIVELRRPAMLVGHVFACVPRVHKQQDLVSNKFEACTSNKTPGKIPQAGGGEALFK